MLKSKFIGRPFLMICGTEHTTEALAISCSPNLCQWTMWVVSCINVWCFHLPDISWYRLYHDIRIFMQDFPLKAKAGLVLLDYEAMDGDGVFAGMNSEFYFKEDENSYYNTVYI